MRRGGFDSSTRERLARIIYDDHLDRAGTGPRTGSEADGPPRFESLSDDERESYRGQAADIAVKLDMIGAVVVPCADAARDFGFTRAQLERLSRHEHARWMREKRRAGWRYGPVEDPVARTDPCLVGYQRLPEPEKDKDRQIVERIPRLLGTVGLGIAQRAKA